MTFLYKCAIYTYTFIIRTTALFNPKARLFIRGRKKWKEKLAGQIETNARYLWFHCASLGEFEQGRPVIEKIKSDLPHFRIILTFFSPSGFEVRKNYLYADIVMYLPTDTRKNARAFLKMVNPEKVFFIKYEYWPFFLSGIKKRNIPLYLISAIFRDNQPFFKNNRWGRWYRKMLFQFDHLFVQNEKSAQLLSSIGIQQYTISGDTRFDRVATIAENIKSVPAVEKFRNQHPLIVAGSTWKPDEELLVRFINHTTGVKMVIAPHEVAEPNIRRLQQMLQKPSVRISEADTTDTTKYEVLIIDSIGLLSSIYRYGDLAYIGGGFGAGIHNILEPATFGLPVVFGPNYTKFSEAIELINRGGAFPVRQYEDLNAIFSSLLENSGKRESASAACKKYVQNNTGATKRIIRKVFP